MDATRSTRLLPIDTLIEALPAIVLDETQANRFADGQRLAWPDDSYRGRVRVYRRTPGAARLLGTGLVGYDERLAPVRLVARAPT